MGSLARISVVLLLICCFHPHCARGAVQASSDVFEKDPFLESSVNMETHIQPVSPTPSSQYHSPTSTPSVTPNGGPGNGVPNNDSVPDLEDPTEQCTFPSADEIAIFLDNTEARVFFTLSTQDRPVCQGGVYGVRLAMWTSSVTNGDTVYYNQLQWGPWVLGALPDNYPPGQHFSTTHADVTRDEAYYAQVAIGNEEEFIDSFKVPTGDVISNVTFLGNQERVQVKSNRSITAYEGDPIRIFCSGQGNPPPSVDVFLPVDTLGQSDTTRHMDTLVILKADLKYTGTVLCIARQYSFAVIELRPTPTTFVSVVPISVTVLATPPPTNTAPTSSATASMAMASTAMPTASPTSSCSEVPWAVCNRLSLSHGQVVPFGGAESGPSVRTVVEAVAQLESSQVHTQECLDAVKQLLCLRHFSPCEDGNQIAPGRPVCGSECTELFTGRCQDTWAAYLGYVGQTSGAYKDHFEGCTGGGSDQECVTLGLSSSEAPPTISNDPFIAVVAVPVAAILTVLGAFSLVLIPIRLRHRQRQGKPTSDHHSKVAE